MKKELKLYQIIRIWFPKDWNTLLYQMTKFQEKWLGVIAENNNSNMLYEFKDKATHARHIDSTVLIVDFKHVVSSYSLVSSL